MRFPYRLPLRFIGLWIANLAVLLAVSFALGIPEYLLDALRISIRNLASLYLALGGILAAVEEWLIDKRKENSER